MERNNLNQNASYNAIRRLLLNYLTNAQNESDSDDESNNGDMDFDSLIVEDELPADQICDLKKHPIYEEIMNAVGNTEQLNSINKMLMKRELGIVNTSSIRPSLSPFFSNNNNNSSHSFSHTDKCNITQRYIPNKCTTILDHESHIFCGQYSLNGSMYMSASKDAKLRLFNTENWSLINTIPARNIGWSIISTDFSPNEQWLIYSSWSDQIHLANTSGRHSIHQALQIVPHSVNRFCLFSIQFSQDSKEIIGGSSDQCIYIYDIERKAQVHQIFAHQDDVNTVSFLDNSCQSFVSGSDDTLIRVWDRRILSNEGNKGCVAVLPGHTQGITHIDSKKDGRYIVSNGKDQCAKLWDLRKTQQPEEALARVGNAFSGWYGGYGSHVNNRSNLRQRHKNDYSIMTYRGHSVIQTLIRVKFSPSFTGNKYIYSGSSDGCVYIYDLITGEIVKTLRGHHSLVRDVAWHPNKPEIVSTSWDGLCKQWTWKEGEESDNESDSERNEEGHHDNDDYDDDYDDDDYNEVDYGEEISFYIESEGDENQNNSNNNSNNDHDLDEFF